jgi:hypothetical protein
VTAKAICHPAAAELVIATGLRSADRLGGLRCIKRGPSLERNYREASRLTLCNSAKDCIAGEVCRGLSLVSLARVLATRKELNK